MTSQSELHRPPRLADLDMGVLLDFGRSLKHGYVGRTDRLSFTFKRPEAGWIAMRIVAGQTVTDWDLSHVLDPFAAAPRPEDEGYFRSTFIHWLEDIANGKATDMAVDMEGRTGAMLIAPASSKLSVTISVLTSPSGLDVVATIERFALIRDFYTALIAFWDSDALNDAWSQWSSQPKWSLRSAIVEDYLAASGAHF